MLHRALMFGKVTLIATALVWLGPLGSTAPARYRPWRTSHSLRGYGSTHGYHRWHHRYRPYDRSTVFHYPRSYWWGYGWSWRPWGWGWNGSPYLGVYLQTGRGGYDEEGRSDYSYGNGAVRVKVRPRETEVYVDGHYEGIVDDFDGAFQRLYLPPGEHELALKLKGYRAYRETLSVRPGRTITIHHEMERIPPGEITAPKPERKRGAAEAPGPAETPRRSERIWRDDDARVPRPSEGTPRQRRGVPPQSRFGKLALRVQPSEAEVFIDGQLWGTAEGLEELVVHLPAGLHRVEIRVEGMEPFATEIEIVAGEATPLNVKLTPSRL